MANGTIIFVHGTGVRLPSYQPQFKAAAKLAAQCGVTQEFVSCPWGDGLGVEFGGKSLPDPPGPQQIREEEEDFARWNWLFDDPLTELDKLTIRDPKESTRADLQTGTGAAIYIPNPSKMPPWEQLWTEISNYHPSPELELLLERGGLTKFWDEAWAAIVEGSSIPRQAFQASPHELADAAHALARALVAQMHVLAEAAGQAGPNRKLRNDLVTRLTVDWNQQVFGLGSFLANRLQRAVTRVLRQHRNSFSDGAALPIGDVLLYQTHGDKIRKFIRDKITNAARPVTLLAHSLGGIACFDLLALPSPPKIDYLVTAGSQSTLLYEIGALTSLKLPDPLPAHFPPWLNFYDRNDFLSYVGGRLFPPRDFELKRRSGFERDFELESGQPFPASHSAYFGNEVLWKTMSAFISQ
jgi:hypothetical protein